MAITDSLISYWAMDEASGSALDSHGSNNLTETGGTIAAATGIVSGARDFESAHTEWFQLADNASLSAGDIDFTWQAWLQLESATTDRTAIYKGDNTSTNFEYLLLYFNSTNRFRFWVTNATSGQQTVDANNLGAPSTGTWYHVLAWHDASANQIGIQVNNGTPNTASYSGGSHDSSGAFRIGQDPLPAYWDGLIDEVAFWKRLLTADEKTWLYNSGSGRAYSEFISATYDLSTSDGSKLSDLTPGGMLYAKSTSDGSKAGDSPAGGLLLPNSLSDGSKAGDTPASNLWVPAYITEATVNTDTPASTLQAAADAVDAVDASDTPANTAVLPNSVADAVDSSDTLTGGLLIVDSTADGAVASDTNDALKIINTAVTEGAVASESWTSLLTALAAAVDGATAGDVAVGLLTILSTLSDATVATDSVIGGLLLTGDSSDATAIAETPAMALQAQAQVVDSTVATDQPVSQQVVAGGLADGVLAADTDTGSLAVTGAVADAIDAADAPAAGVVIPGLAVDAAVLTELPAALLVMLEQLAAEGVTVSDLPSVVASVYAVAVTEGSVAADAFISALEEAFPQYADYFYVLNNITLSYVLETDTAFTLQNPDTTFYSLDCSRTQVTALKTHYRIVGDTLTPIGATLKRNGSVIDLTDYTVQFKMVNDAGTVIVNWASATIVSATAGTVQYDFQPADVATAGVYWVWFRIKSAGNEYDTFPSNDEARRMRVVLRTAS